MRDRELRAEMVIKINSQEDLDKISNIKLDLQLLESPRKERQVTKPEIELEVRSVTRPVTNSVTRPVIMADINPETNPPVPAPLKVLISVKTIKAKATVKPVKRPC